MEKSELIEYLGMVIDVEQNLNTQRQAYSKLSSSLKFCNDEKERLNADLKRTISPKKSKSITGDARGGIFSDIIASIITFIIIFAVSTFVLFIFLAEDIGKGVPFTFLISLGITIYTTIGMKKDSERKYQKEMEKYREKIESKKLTISASEVKIDYLTKQLESLKEIIANSEKNLKMLYDCDFIHPKYKRLDYVVLIYECLDTGRCDKLEGADGAYNKVELDHRLDNISSQIGTMINSLGDIKGILSSMRNDIGRMTGWIQSVDSNITLLNQTTQNGNEVLKQIEEKSELIAYQQERTAREIEYANRINYLQGKNKIGILADNRPPHLQ